MIKNIKALAIGLLISIAATSSAWCQCSGQAPTSTYCGNSGPSLALPSFRPLSGVPLTMNVTPIIGGISGGILFNNGGVISSTDSVGSANLLTSGTLTIAIPAGALTAGSPSRALNTSISITGGPFTGALYSNLHSGIMNSVVRGNGLAGSPTGANWILSQFSASIGALYDTQDSVGTQVVGQAFGISAGMVTNAANNTKSDLVGGSFGFSNWFNLQFARGYGITASATVAENPNLLGTFGTTPTLIAGEFAASIAVGGTVQDRLGVNIISYLTGTASRLNSAISIMRGNPGGEFSQLITLNPYQDGVTQPNVLKTDGDIIYVPTAQTISSIVNAPLLNLSGYIVNTKYVKFSDRALALGTSAVTGGLSLDGPSATAIFATLKQNGTGNFTFGLTTGGNFTIGNALTAANPLVIDKTTSIVTINNGMAVNGAFALGAFNFSIAAAISLPAVVQGDLWYGSAAGTISALAKDAGASRFLKNSGTSNNPVWAQPAFTDLSGSIAASQMPALTGDITTSAGAVATTLATVNSNVGTFGSATQTSQVTVNAKGLVTAAANVTVTPAVGSITGLGTGVATALAINVGSAGAPVLFNGALGTPSSGSIATTLLTGALQAAQEPAHTGDVTNSAGSLALTLATAQPAVHTWALAQTFTVAPVFTDASGSRTALGLGTMATQAANSVAVTGGTVAGLTGFAIRDTSAAFDVTIAATSSSALSVGRTLTLNVGNVAHTLALGTIANTITFPNLASYTVITNGDTGTVTNTMLANSSVTVNGTAISLGASGTVTAAAGTLTGATLAAGVTASSLTSLGTITSLTATTINAFTMGGAISGGGNQINNVIIGTTNPLAGFFTTLNATGTNITLSNATPELRISKTASGQDTTLLGQTGGLNRWLVNIGDNTAEGGANAGSNFGINRYSDAGSFVGTPFTINRATGAVTMANALTVAGLPTSAGAGGINVCVDTSGVFYKKASCP